MLAKTGATQVVVMAQAHEETIQCVVQAAGGLSIEQAIQCPAYGAPLVGLGAPSNHRLGFL